MYMYISLTIASLFLLQFSHSLSTLKRIFSREGPIYSWTIQTVLEVNHLYSSVSPDAGVGDHNCEHTEDSGVICTPDK